MHHVQILIDGKLVKEAMLAEASISCLAFQMLAWHIAAGIVENARDNGDDPSTYSMDEEIVELYAKDLASTVSHLLPQAVNEANAETSPSVAQFAMICNGKTSDQIHELFNDGISDQLRDEIFACLPAEDADTPEPTRGSLNAIGHKYNIESLINY